MQGVFIRQIILRYMRVSKSFEILLLRCKSCVVVLIISFTEKEMCRHLMMQPSCSCTYHGPLYFFTESNVRFQLFNIMAVYLPFFYLHFFYLPQHFHTSIFYTHQIVNIFICEIICSSLSFRT